MTPVDGSPSIVGGAKFLLQCESWSLHQHALLWGPPMTLQGFLAAGGSLAGSLMSPSLSLLHWC